MWPDELIIRLYVELFVLVLTNEAARPTAMVTLFILIVIPLKLFEWTNERWIITFSKEKGKASIKDEEKNKKKQIIENTKKTELYKDFLNKFPDANLIDVSLKEE